MSSVTSGADEIDNRKIHSNSFLIKDKNGEVPSVTKYLAMKAYKVWTIIRLRF
jgi:hypothetical protein